MATTDLRNTVKEYIDTADVRLLKMMNALAESYQEEDADHEISKEQREILDQRLADHKADPNVGKEWNQLRSELRSKHGA